MKLLLYSHFFAPSIGGVETIVQSLAAGLAELRDANSRSFEVTVVTHTTSTDSRDIDSGFRIVRRPNPLQLWRLIRASDVVHVAGPAILPMTLCLFSRKPFVVEHHGYQAICPNGLLLHRPDATDCPGYFQTRRYLQCVACLRSEMSLPAAIINLLFTFPRYTLSLRTKANLAITKHVMTRHALPSTTVVYYGIEPAPAMSVDLDSKSINFAYVGRLVPEKGLGILVEAAALVKKQRQDFAVRFVGHGPERHQLEQAVALNRLEDAVTFTGFLTGPALINALRDVHVVVMPSVWEETAGLAAIEQMMRGRLVIASRIGGLAEVVGDAGMTFAPGSSSELAQCMLRILDEPSLIEAYGRKARTRALQLFQRTRMIQEHASIYRSCVS
jgi:glycogen synthase